MPLRFLFLCSLFAPAAALATSLGFTTSPQGLVAGACSAQVGIQFYDDVGAPANVGLNTRVNLFSTAASTGFYSDPGCQTAITRVTIAAGTGSAGFYWLDTAVGAVTLSITATSTSPASLDDSVIAASAQRLAFASVPEAVVAGTCSSLIELRAEDAFGNPIAISATTPLVITLTSPTARLFADPACTVPLTLSTECYLIDTQAGSLELTASGAGLTPVTTPLNVTAGPASKLALLDLPDELIRGQAASFRVKALDIWGNVDPTYAGTVRLQSTDAAAVVPQDYVFGPTDQGEHTFASGVTFGTAGSFTLAADDATSKAVAGSHHNLWVLLPSRPICDGSDCRYLVGCGCAGAGAGAGWGPLALLGLGLAMRVARRRPGRPPV